MVGIISARGGKKKRVSKIEKKKKPTEKRERIKVQRLERITKSGKGNIVRQEVK